MSRNALRVGGWSIGLFLLLTAAARMGLVNVPIERSTTHEFWYISRASGVAAYLALTASMVWGLLVSTSLGDRWVQRGLNVDLHRWISGVALALTGGHMLALLGDGFIRFDALDLLVPFLAPYRPAAVALGIVSAYLLAAVQVSFSLRGRLGQRGWRLVHGLSFAVFFGVTLHGIQAGTDSGLWWMRGLYVGAAAMVGLLTAVRLVQSAGIAGRPSLTAAGTDRAPGAGLRPGSSR